MTRIFLSLVSVVVVVVVVFVIAVHIYRDLDDFLVDSFDYISSIKFV